MYQLLKIGQKQHHFGTVGHHLYFGNGSKADDVTSDKLSSIFVHESSMTKNWEHLYHKIFMVNHLHWENLHVCSSQEVNQTHWENLVRKTFMVNQSHLMKSVQLVQRVIQVWN